MLRILENSQDFFQISSSDLQFHEQIGLGTFGAVYRATWLTRHHIVAVKQLCVTPLNDEAKRKFFKEVSLLDRLRSPYIVNFYGACIETDNCILVMEYMSLGSLYNLLHEDYVKLTWLQRLSIALQAARGINYLHQLQPRVLHRDIKSGNFLLERSYEGYTVKTCNFGFTQIQTVMCTSPWTAPEIFRLEDYTDKSDIYSLGVIYWELASSQIPYYGYQDRDIRASVLDGRRLSISENNPSSFRQLIQQCWRDNPNERPNSSDLIEMIETCIKIQSNSLLCFL
ncbi:unnamed protein product [Rotaria sp. Silwood2]|nr:unnamed protein product [Rotaria sp. Silwood2]